MTIDEIKQQIDIKDLLIKLGANFNGNGKGKICCIFHPDKDPSLTVNQEKGKFYCFGCKQGGDIFDAVGLAHNCPGSVNLHRQMEILSRMYNFEITPLTPEVKKRQMDLRLSEEILGTAADFYHNELINNKEMLDYVLSRGITRETIDRLKIGYTSGNIVKHLLGKYKKEEILTTGLFVKSGNGVSIFLNNRILFPYWKSGRIIYGIGRKTNYTPDNEYEKGKYKKILTHTENRPYVITENRYLYNEDCMKTETDFVIITEGIIDSILLDQLGLPVISPITTQFSNFDVEKLITQCKKARQVYIINDNEENNSGLKGGLKTARELMAQGQIAKIVIIPKEIFTDKIDIADYITQGHGKEEILELCKNSKTYIDFLLDEIPQDTGPAELNEKITELFKMLSNLPEITRENIIKQVSKKYKISKSILRKIHQPADIIPAEVELKKSIKDGYYVDYINHKCEREKKIGDYKYLDPISNFSGIINKEVTKDDGIYTTKYFHGTFTNEEKRTFSFEISFKDWVSGTKFMEALVTSCGSRAQIYPGEERHTANAIFAFSNAKEETIYTHTGWSGENYIFPGVSITPDGLTEDINVQLPDGCERICFKKISIDKAKEVIEQGILKGFINIYEPAITLPALAHVFVPIIADKIGVNKKYVLWISGTTGKYKTSVSCIIQSFYGNFVDEVPLETWRSTQNAIEKKGFYCKDMIYLIDDYKKGQVGWGQEFFIQSYADNTSRGRLDKSSELRKKYPIRGYIVSTGEDTPTGEASLTSRMIPLEIKTKGDLRYLELTQQYADDFRGITPLFIQYIIQNVKPEDIQERFKKSRAIILEEIIKNKNYGEVNIGRIAFNLALNSTGLFYFIEFCRHLKIDNKLLNDILKIYSVVSTNFIPEIQAQVKNESASEIFISTLRELISSQRVQIIPEFETPEKYTDIVGFTKEDFVYIYPQMAYMAVQESMRKSGEVLKFSRNAIWKQLQESGFIARCNKGRTTYNVFRDGNSIKTLCFNKNLLISSQQSEKEEETPDVF